MEQLQPPNNPTTNPSATLGGGAPGSNLDQRMYELSIKVAGIERSMAYLEAASQDTRTELKAISDKIVAASASFDTAKRMVKPMLIGFWAVVGALATAGLGLAAAWFKHAHGW